jgi:hypothetical protein
VGGYQSQSEYFKEEEKPLPLLATEPQFFSCPVCSSNLFRLVYQKHTKYLNTEHSSDMISCLKMLSGLLLLKMDELSWKMIHTLTIYSLHTPSMKHITVAVGDNSFKI